MVPAIVALLLSTGPSRAATVDTVYLRGHSQLVRLFGTPGAGVPVIVSSGDGGWIHLGPHVAEALAARGYFVIGFDTRAYLGGFTSGASTLRPEDVAADYRELVRYAARGSPGRPVLVGVSEGAGLSVLAAADDATKSLIGGVVAIGLPDLNELGWRWKDAWIYVTHGVPNEPTFSSAAFVGRVSPLPLAVIHSTRDEFVTAAQIQSTMDRAAEPKQLWMIDAADHRFSNNLPELDRRLLEAISWVTARARASHPQ
jgi:alpha-beta hydrolase superfamily lysophospholipase